MLQRFRLLPPGLHLGSLGCKHIGLQAPCTLQALPRCPAFRALAPITPCGRKHDLSLSLGSQTVYRLELCFVIHTLPASRVNVVILFPPTLGKSYLSELWGSMALSINNLGCFVQLFLFIFLKKHTTLVYQSCSAALKATDS